MGVGAKVRLEDIQVAVVVEIADAQSHAALFAAVLVESDPSLESALGEGSVVVVAEEQARRSIAGDIDVGPAVAIEIGGSGGQGIVRFYGENAGLLADVRESAVAVVVIEAMPFLGHAVGTAEDRDAPPDTQRVLAANRNRVGIEY